jgi:hypothetical protein
VHTREIDQIHRPLPVQHHAPDVLLDGDAGIVGDLLTEARQLVEEGGLAGVGRPDQRDEGRADGLVE